MKTLMNKIIIYDDVCPLCKAYTSGFVQLGWLLPEHRMGFSTAPSDILTRIDIDRARHEIPLYDTLTGETLYGKDALFYIISEQIPLFKPLFRFKLFRAFIYFLYQIITYNRRIIAGSSAPKTGFDCAPDFNLKYRLIYIFIMSFILSISFLPLANVLHISLLCLLILRGVMYPTLQQRIDYWGHSVTVLFIVKIFSFIISDAFLLVLIGAYFMFRRTVQRAL